MVEGDGPGETAVPDEGAVADETGPGAARRGARAAQAVRTLREPPAMLDRYELVLLLVVATIAVQGLVDVRGSVFAQLFTHAISGVALVAAARASGARRSWRRAVDIMVVGVLILSVAATSLLRGNAAVPPETTWLLAAALTPILIARRLLQHRVVTVQTIMGAVAAYLQIAVAYAFLFQTIDAYSATDFFGQDVPTTTYMYFSLITISTVGFGDFTAVTEFGRMASASEAVIGQVFLVTFVALIVSRFAAGMQAHPTGADADSSGADEPPRTLLEALSSSQEQPLPPADPDDVNEQGRRSP